MNVPRAFQFNIAMKNQAMMDKESPWSSFETPQDVLSSPWSSFEESSSTDALHDIARGPSPREGRRGSFFDMHADTPSDVPPPTAPHASTPVPHAGSPSRGPHMAFHAPRPAPHVTVSEAGLAQPYSDCWTQPQAPFPHGHQSYLHRSQPLPHAQQHPGWGYANPLNYAYSHEQNRKPWGPYPSSEYYDPRAPVYPSYSDRYGGAQPSPAPYQGPTYRPDEYYQHRPYPEPHPTTEGVRADWCRSVTYPVPDYPPQPTAHHTDYTDGVYTLNPYSLSGPRGPQNEGRLYCDGPTVDRNPEKRRTSHVLPEHPLVELPAPVVPQEIPSEIRPAVADEGAGQIQSQPRKRGKRSKKAKKVPQVDVTDKRYKTVRCSHWNKRGKCPFGSHCMFAHGAEDLNIVPKAPKEPRTVEADPNTGIFMKLVSEAYGVTIPEDWDINPKGSGAQADAEHESQSESDS